jgi:hypothetical protein
MSSTGDNASNAMPESDRGTDEYIYVYINGDSLFERYILYIIYKIGTLSIIQERERDRERAIMNQTTIYLHTHTNTHRAPIKHCSHPSVIFHSPSIGE